MSRAVGSISSAVGGPAEVWLGAVRVDGPRGGCLPAVLVHELGQRAAAHRAVVPRRAAERDGGRDGHLVGDAEQRAQLRLHEGVPGGHHPAVAEGPGRQQQVLAGRVDAGALGGSAGRGSGRGRGARPPAWPRSGRRSAASCGPSGPWARTSSAPEPLVVAVGGAAWPPTSPGTTVRAAPSPRRPSARRAAPRTGTAGGWSRTAPGWRATGSRPGRASGIGSSV